MLIARWTSSLLHSPLRRMGADTLLVSATFLFARGIGFVREIVVAFFYGLSDAIDIYVAAVAFIALPVLILSNAAQPALVAALAQKARSPGETGRLLVHTLLLSAGPLLALLPIWLFILPVLFPVLSAGFAEEKQQALFQALVWLIPYYLLTGINLLAYSALQAQRRFLSSGLIPVVTPLVAIVVVATTADISDWRPLIVAINLGTVAETTTLFMLLGRAGYFKGWNRGTSGVKSVMTQAMMLMPGTVMTAVGPMADQAIAASIGSGSNATLSYGYKLPTALISVTAAAIGVAALPHFANWIAERRFDYSLRSIDKLWRVLLLGGALIVFPLILFSEQIVAILYQRGAFDEEAVVRVADVQIAYLVQLPFAILAILGARALSALGRYSLLSVYTLTIPALQVFLAYGLAREIGVAGIAWAAVAGSAAVALLTLGSARRELRRLMT